MFAEEPPINPDSTNRQKSPFSDSDNNRHPATASDEDIATVNRAAVDDLHKTLQSNLLKYQERYRQTGQLDFIPFEIVAQMAAEGRVFVPDQAEQKIQQITAAAQGAQAAALALQAALLDLSGLQGRRESALRKLLALNEESIMLITLVERDVMPVAGVVSAQRQLEMEYALQDMEMLMYHFVAQFESEIAEHSVPAKQTEPSIAHCLTQFMGKNKLIAIASTEIIKARVPFYRLLA